MLINVKNKGGIHLGEKEVLPTSFRELFLKESDVEEFLRKNIELIFEEESLLIVGQQLIDSESGRSDLVAVDENGDLVLIEIKRDKEDIKNRKEPLELQAIRYAATLAKISNPDALVEIVFANYIEKNGKEFELSGLTPTEKGKRLLNSFLRNNNAIKTFNSKQRIILISSSFDSLTLSSVSWLISNNVDISCFCLAPLKIADEIFIEVSKILPPMKLSDYYVEVKQTSGGRAKSLASASSTKRTNLPRIAKLIEWGLISPGDILFLKNQPDSEATVVDHQTVKFKDRNLTYNHWGQEGYGWSSICIYDWAVSQKHNKTLAVNRLPNMTQVGIVGDPLPLKEDAGFIANHPIAVGHFGADGGSIFDAD